MSTDGVWAFGLRWVFTKRRDNSLSSEKASAADGSSKAGASAAQGETEMASSRKQTMLFEGEPWMPTISPGTFGSSLGNAQGKAVRSGEGRNNFKIVLPENSHDESTAAAATKKGKREAKRSGSQR